MESTASACPPVGIMKPTTAVASPTVRSTHFTPTAGLGARPALIKAGWSGPPASSPAWAAGGKVSPARAPDFPSVAQTALTAGRARIDQEDFAAAAKALDPAIAMNSAAELHELRAKARRLLNDFAGADADYTRAIELAETGV